MAICLEQSAGLIHQEIARQSPVIPAAFELQARLLASGMFIAPNFSRALPEDKAVALAKERLDAETS